MKLVGQTLFSLAMLLLFVSSCNSTKDTVKEDTKLNISDDKSYVMTFLLELENSTDTQIAIYDVITTEGSLKDNSVVGVDPEHKYLASFEFSDNSTPINQSFSDPLNKTVEYVDDEGNLAKKKVSLDSEVISLRLNYQKLLSQLKIYEQIESEFKLIASFPLNQ